MFSIFIKNLHAHQIFNLILVLCFYPSFDGHRPWLLVAIQQLPGIGRSPILCNNSFLAKGVELRSTNFICFVLLPTNQGFGYAKPSINL
jgi:hypothetical protein